MKYAKDLAYGFILLLVGCVFLYQHTSWQVQFDNQNAQIQILRDETKALTQTYENREMEWVNRYESLNTEFKHLNSSHAQLKSEYESLDSEKGKVDAELEDLSEVYQNEFTNLMDGLTDFEDKIQASLDWFQEAKNLEDIRDYAQLKLDLFADCVEYDETTCEIKLYCMPFINKHEYGVEYKTDESTVDKIDYLLTLEEIWDNGGGDCEDISALFTAQFDYLINRCEMQGYTRDQITLTSMEYEAGGRTIVSNEADYYYSDTTPVAVTHGGNYMYPVCGLFPGQPTGHCVVAITQEPILSNADIPRILQGAPMVEPQIGNYLGRIGEDGPLRIYESGDEIEYSNFVSLVIVGNDIAYFYVRTGENEWRGYTEFLDEVQTQKESLREFYRN